MHRTFHAHPARFWALVGVWLLAALALDLPLVWLIVTRYGPAVAEPSPPRASVPRGFGHECAPERTGEPISVAVRAPTLPVERTDPVEKPPEKRSGSPPVPVLRPEIPRHHAHIRIAQLAYYANPMGAFEDDLLREHVDLVVPEAHFLEHIHMVAPRTPQLLYTNTSSLYFDLLPDWLTYADRKKLSAESAFYHAAKPTAFQGNSPSSRPVTWFWRVFRGDDRLSDVTHLV